jgi:uncharacterized protein (TIGR00251 family)
VSHPRIERTATGVRVTIRVQPRASKSEIAGLHGDALKVRLTAPPVDGAANEALIKFLAGTFGVPVRAITILTGASSRTKVVQMDGVTEDSVRRLMI